MKYYVIKILVMSIGFFPTTIARAATQFTPIQISTLQNGNSNSSSAQCFETPQLDSQQNRKILRQFINKKTQANAHLKLGNDYKNRGKLERAIHHYEQALNISKKISDCQVIAIAQSNIGDAYKSKGDFKSALEFLNQALIIFQKSNDLSGKARTLNNISSAYYINGDFNKALESGQEALSILEHVNASKDKARIIRNIGETYRKMGNLKEALKLYNQALHIHQELEVKDKLGEAHTLNGIGVIYRNIRQSTLSMDKEQDLFIFNLSVDNFNNALHIFQRIKNPEGEAAALNNLGEVYINKNSQEAVKQLKKARLIRQNIGDKVGEISTLQSLGRIARASKEFKKALIYFNKALSISRSIENRLGEESSLNNIALVYTKQNQFERAITYLEKDQRVILNLRQGLKKENRKLFLDEHSGTAIALIDMLINKKRFDDAFRWANLSSTVDLADYNRIINAKVLNPQVQQEIENLDRQYQKLQSQFKSLSESGKFSDALADKFRDDEAKLNRKRHNISSRFPEVAELFESTPRDITQLRASIPSGTTVIYPFLLTNVNDIPNTIAFFIITKEKVTVVKKNINPSNFDSLLIETSQNIADRGGDNYTNKLIELYNLLIRPIESQIQSTNPKQLSIIATGKLRYLPFEALYDSRTEQYLIQKYAISYLTRLSTRSLADKSYTNTPKKILALGNPRPNTSQSLLGTEDEVNRIAKIMPNSKALIGSNATLRAFKNQALQFSLLHLATHGCFQKGGCKTIGLEENTILFADQQLNIADAAFLGLQNIDLITLSACQTALETESNGEQIAGLAYLFERAGAKSTIASLWNVYDETAPDIMVDFYKNINNKMSKGEALRLAKLKYINSYPPLLAHPFYWAPFILIGDPR
jgi:CHAT domain-containing protein/Tfp pilus assembly protein PilF